jgi:hypothetical protein
VVVVHSGGPLVFVGLGRAAFVVVGPGPVRVVPGLSSAGARSSEAASHAHARHPTREEFPDATGYEALVNKVHLELPEGSSDVVRIASGIAALDHLQRAVESLADAGPVRLILAVSLAAEYPSVTLRFHRRRAGEEWLALDLEGYEQEAILVRDL